MYYKIPFDMGSLLDGNDAATCSGSESIAHHLQTLITTRPGENRYDAAYGNAIWELEFDNGVSNARWEELFQQSVQKAVNIYEPRLANAIVTIHTELVEKTWPMRNFTEIKKKVTVLVKAQLKESGEKYSFKTELFLSPMSID